MHVVARQMRFFAGYADKFYGKTIPLDNPSLFDYTLREPLGVIVMITPWNSPIALMAGKLCPALAAGNTAIVKPSRNTSASTLEFAKLVERRDSQGSLQRGDGGYRRRLPDEVSESQQDQPDGRNRGGATHPQAGGEQHHTRHDGTRRKESEHRLRGCQSGSRHHRRLSGIFQAAGQTCVAGSRLLVQDSVYDRVVSGVVEGAKRIKLGDPFKKETGMGRLRTGANSSTFYP